MKQTKKEKIKFKLSSFLFGLGFGTLIFSYLVILVIQSAVTYFPIANEADHIFANCVMEKIDVKNQIFTTCNQFIKEKYGQEIFPGKSCIEIEGNITCSEGYGLGFNFPLQFYDFADTIWNYGILFGLFFLIAGIIILRFKNY